eukprot:GHVU01090944.1.p1 GENE.GHVU01090944.1~~GHVU01090944.1.p1  ORF type:complete len:111 (-),score=4.28 GHVU01090944.1:1064-1396(-)
MAELVIINTFMHTTFVILPASLSSGVSFIIVDSVHHPVPLSVMRRTYRYARRAFAVMRCTVMEANGSCKESGCVGLASFFQSQTQPFFDLESRGMTYISITTDIATLRIV